jgi:hypothetical protein
MEEKFARKKMVKLEKMKKRENTPSDWGGNNTSAFFDY